MSNQRTPALLRSLVLLNDNVLSSAIQAGMIRLTGQFFDSETLSQFETKLDLVNFQLVVANMIQGCLARLPGSRELRQEIIQHGVLDGVVQWLRCPWMDGAEPITASSREFLVMRTAMGEEFLLGSIRHAQPLLQDRNRGSWWSAGPCRSIREVGRFR